MSSTSTARPPATAAWLGMLLTPGLGNRGAQQLLRRFDGAEAVLAASLTSLEAAGVSAGVAQHLHDGRSLALGVEEAEKAQLLGTTVITQGDDGYPELLREIYDPPLVLYIRGDLNVLDAFGVAVVGTRKPTVYGRLMAERFGRELAQWGLTVFSGLARGIDSVAQRACVEAGGSTVAVLGTGMDLIYPREHEKLAEAILARHGALITEFPLGTIPAAQNFPIRNRIISGLALGVLVIEGGEFSGSRITARMALEQNRDVYAVPGMVTQKQAWLPNILIKQGAKLVMEVADIIEEMPSAVRSRLTPPPVAAAAGGQEPSAAGGLAATVLGALGVDQAAQVDEIANRLENRFSAAELLTALLELEMGGRIRQLPGKNYLRVS